MYFKVNEASHLYRKTFTETAAEYSFASFSVGVVKLNILIYGGLLLLLSFIMSFNLIEMKIYSIISTAEEISTDTSKNLTSSNGISCSSF